MKKMNCFQENNKHGFTLIEVLIVIGILGVLASLVSGNLMNSMKRGRDAKRKEDLQQIKNALEMYYEDNKQYPGSLSFGNQLTHPKISKTYMQKIPKDPLAEYTYQYKSISIGTGTSNAYNIYSQLENKEDAGPGSVKAVSPNVAIDGGYNSTDCCSGSANCYCRFGVASYNSQLNETSGGSAE